MERLEIIKEMLSKNHTLQEIGDFLGVTKQRVSLICKSNNIGVDRKGISKKVVRIEESIIEKFKEIKSVPLTAKHFKLSNLTVYKVLKAQGVAYKDYKRENPRKIDIIRMKSEGKKIKEIIEETGFCRQTIYRILKSDNSTTNRVKTKE